MKIALLMLLLVATASPVLAAPHLRNRPGVCEPSGSGNGHSDRPGQRDDSGAGT
jgi:hypothetical protein